MVGFLSGLAHRVLVCLLSRDHIDLDLDPSSGLCVLASVLVSVLKIKPELLLASFLRVELYLLESISCLFLDIIIESLIEAQRFLDQGAVFNE